MNGFFGGGIDVTAPPLIYVTVRPPGKTEIEFWRVQPDGKTGELMGHLLYGYTKMNKKLGRQVTVLVERPVRFPNSRSCWDIDQDIIYPTGSLVDTAVERIESVKGGDTWTWRNSPRVKLTDTEIEEYAQGKKISGAKWAPGLNWQVESGHMMGRLIEVDAQGNPR